MTGIYQTLLMVFAIYIPSPFKMSRYPTKDLNSRTTLENNLVLNQRTRSGFQILTANLLLMLMCNEFIMFLHKSAPRQRCCEYKQLLLLFMVGKPMQHCSRFDRSKDPAIFFELRCIVVYARQPCVIESMIGQANKVK